MPIRLAIYSPCHNHLEMCLVSSQVMACVEDGAGLSVMARGTIRIVFDSRAIARTIVLEPACC